MTQSQARILIVEDEAPIRRFLRASLASQEFEVIEASTGREALALAGASAPDLVLLDLGLPDLDGLEVLNRLREFAEVPVVVVSARGQEHDKIAALDSGADDYLTKPFGVGELLARIRVALRHRSPAGAMVPETVACGDLCIDLAARRVLRGGAEVRLTPNEWRLLALLARHAGKVVTQKQILKDIWGAGRTGNEHYVRVYMHQLRQKLEVDPADPQLLLTEPWVGYRLVTDNPPEGA